MVCVIGACRLNSWVEIVIKERSIIFFLSEKFLSFVYFVMDSLSNYKMFLKHRVLNLVPIVKSLQVRIDIFHVRLAYWVFFCFHNVFLMKLPIWFFLIKDIKIKIFWSYYFTVCKVHWYARWFCWYPHPCLWFAFRSDVT